MESERRLAAILAGDVVGYSKLMGADEAGTLARVKALMREVVEPAIGGRHGRVVKTTGDGFLAAFASVFEAFEAACEIQRQVGTRQATPADAGIELRLGLNVGDIIFDEGDVFGDGVNVAARLESLAAPGTVCLSNRAWEDLRRLPLEFIDEGDRTLKNIAQPVRVYSHDPRGGGGKRASPAPASGGDRPRWLWPALVAVAALAVVAGGLVAWRQMRPAPSQAALVAVLPFEAIGADPETRGLAAGLTDQIVTTLSDNHIQVLSRGDTATLAGADRSAAEQRLGVALLVDGTVDRDGADARVRVHLTDARRQVTLWSKEISAAAADRPVLQARTASTVAAVLGCSRRALAPGQGLVDPSVLTRYLTACDLFANQDDASGPQQTFQMLAALREVTQKAPKFAPAHADLAKFDAYLSPLMPPEQANAMRTEATREAEAALSREPKSPDAYLARAMLLQPTQWSAREALLRQGVAADPEWPHTNGFLGMFMNEVGRIREGRVYTERAAAADLQIDWAPTAQLAQIAAGQLDPALSQLQAGAKLAPSSAFRFSWLLQGLEDARRWREAEEALAHAPNGWQRSPARGAAELAFLHAAQTRSPADRAKAHDLILAAGRSGARVASIQMLSELGYLDDAFALADGYQPTPPIGGGTSTFLFTPLTENLRRDPRFIRLAARVGLVAYWKASGHWPDYCADPMLTYSCKAMAG